MRVRWIESPVYPGYVVDTEPGDQQPALWCHPEREITVSTADILWLLEIASPEWAAEFCNEEAFDLYMQRRSDLATHVANHVRIWERLGQLATPQE